MNILDIAENSVRADASLVEIALEQDTAQGTQLLRITDNGKGMDAEMLARVTDPFSTTRTTRKVGLGLPFLKMATQLTDGWMDIKSEVGVGTTVTASFGLDHIDLMPLGDIGGTLSTLVQGTPGIDFVFYFQRDGGRFCFDTRQARLILEGVPLNEPQVVLFIKDHVTAGVAAVLKGEPPEELG